MSSKKKCRQYNCDYLRFGFIASQSNSQLPECIVCNTVLSNDSMRPSKLEAHLQKKHPDIATKPRAYFTQLRDQRTTASTQLRKFVVPQNSTSGLTASYKIAYLMAKQGRAHTLAEQLIKPAILEAFNVANVSNPQSVLASIPLSNDTISRRISDMAANVEFIITNDLHNSQFSLTLDESTFSNQAVVLAFVRFVKDRQLKEELLFIKTVVNTTGESVYNTVCKYFEDHGIDKRNMISICTDGAPSMVGKKQGVVGRFLQDRTIFTMHCVLHRENLVAKDLGGTTLMDCLKIVVSAINKIKARALQDRLFREACQDEHFKCLLYYTEVRWLSMGNCLSRFVALFDRVVEFLSERDANLTNKLIESKSTILYLEAIFGKLNELNMVMQSQNFNIVDAKRIIKSFMNKLIVWAASIRAGNFSHFPKLANDVCNPDLRDIILVHLEVLYTNFQLRFEDLIVLTVPAYIDCLHVMTVDQIIDFPENIQMELCQVLGDDKMISMSKQNWVAAWLENSEIYPEIFKKVYPFIVNLPTSVLAEKGFSVVLHSFAKQRMNLKLCDNAEIRLRLSEIAPDFTTLVGKRQAQGSH